MRWLQARSFAFAPEHFNVTEGLVAALAVTSIVLAAYLLQRPALAWAAFAAFWTALIDPGESDRKRLRSMLGFAIAGGLLAGSVSFVASSGLPYTAAVLSALVYLLGMGRYLRTYLGQVGVLMNVVVVVAAGLPNHFHDALALVGIFSAGGLLAVVLYVAMWRFDPSRAAHRAVAAVMRSLRSMAFDLRAVVAASACHGERTFYLESDHRRAVRDAIEVAKQKIAATQADDDQLHAVLETCDKMFAAMVALSHHYRTVSHGRATCRACELLEQWEVALDDAARQTMRNLADWSQVATTAAQLASYTEESDGLAAHIINTLGRELRMITELSAAAPKGSTPVQAPLPRASGKPAFALMSRHALRVSIVVVATFLVTKALHLPYAYWATMAAVVVMQPKSGISWPRMLERIAGSIAGAVAAALITMALTQPWQLLLLIFPLAAATVALRSVNYTLYVLFLTPLFVFVDDLVGPGLGVARDIAFARATDNVLGCLLSLAGWLLIYAERNTRRLPALIATAIEANFNYAAVAIQPSGCAQQAGAARRSAGVASNEAETALHRMILEGRRQRDYLDEARLLLATLRRVAGASTLAALNISSNRSSDAGIRSVRYAKLGRSLSASLLGRHVIMNDNVRTSSSFNDLDLTVESVMAAHRKYVTSLVTRRV